jgi:hypothetical protein
LITLIEAVKHGATFLNCLKLDKLWVVAIRHFKDELSGLEFFGAAFRWEYSVQATFYFK